MTLFDMLLIVTAYTLLLCLAAGALTLTRRIGRRKSCPCPLCKPQRWN